jgi:7-cyano-7-deazaguanine synthase
VAERMGVARHVVVDFDLRQFGGSALTSDLDVPKERSTADMSHGIPITYVPARNTIFLSFALAWAETLGSSDIFVGVNALDYSGYPDCRAEYIQAYEQMANLATKAGVEGTQRLKIHTSLIRLTKAQIIKTGLDLGVDYAITSSCYDPGPEVEQFLVTTVVARTTAFLRRCRVRNSVALASNGGDAPRARPWASTR